MIENQEAEERTMNAIQELREEPAPFEPKSRLIEAMLRQPRRAHPAQWAVAGATALLPLAAMLLWPQQRAFAWDGVVQATLAHTTFHSIYFKRTNDGKGWERLVEAWVDGEKYADQFPIEHRPLFKGKNHITRFDGRRFFSFDGNYGVVSDFKIKKGRSPSWQFSLDELLKSKWLKFEGQPERTELNGAEVLKYSAEQIGHPAGRVAFYADAKTGVLVRADYFDPSGTLTGYEVVDTPASIPASQFEPPTSGMRVVDLDIERAKLETIMSHGIPFGQGNVLRAVIGGGYKSLKLEWTGAHPDADGTPHAHVEGFHALSVSSDTNFGLLSDGRAAGGFKYKGQPLYTLNYVLDKPVGKFVDLDIPVLVEDKTKPIIDRDGKLLGYWSKQVGTKRLAHVPVHDVYCAFGNL